MTERPAVANRFQFSVRSLLAATAILALLLVPIVWVTRQREQMRLAREEAIRAVVLAERYRSKIEERSVANRLAASQAADRIEQLETENAELKDTVELLRKSRPAQDQSRSKRENAELNDIWSNGSEKRSSGPLPIPLRAPAGLPHDDCGYLTSESAGPYDLGCYGCWWPDVAACDGRQTGNPV